MRKVIGIIILAVIISAYCGAWFYAADKLTRNITKSVTQLRAKGYNVQFDNFKVEGFPFKISTQLHNLKIQRTDHFKTWVDGKLHISTSIWHPGTISSIAGGDHHLELKFDDNNIVLKGQGFELINASFDGSDTSIKYQHVDLVLRADRVFHAQNVMVHLTKLQEIAGQPACDLKVQMQQLQSPLFKLQTLGDTIKSVKLDARLIGTIEGVTLIERLNFWSSKGGTVELAKIALEWGDLNVDASGTFSLDQSLQPIAAMSAKISGLDTILKTMVAEKIIDKTVAKAVKAGIEFFSVQDDDGSGHFHNVISISLQDGALSVGPITLLKVPKLKLS